jgi:hypothetical protein
MKSLSITKKKLYYPYIIFGFILFIILFSLNFFYNKYILDLTRGYKYKVTAVQFHNYKYTTYGEIFEQIFNDKIKTLHRVRDANVDTTGLTLKKKKSTFNVTLILNDYVDEKKLENIINTTYFGLINKALKELENNSHLYDIEKINLEYERLKQLDIKEAHYNLINSDFFKKYSIQECNKTEEYCLYMYSSFYDFILTSMQLGNESKIKDFLNMEGNENLAISEVYRDFAINKSLFGNKKIYDLLKENNSKNSYYENYYSKQFDNLMNSKFYSEYDFDIVCENYNISCFKKISDNFKKLLYQHKIETKHPYKIKYLKPKERERFHIFSELIKILGFTLLITYILFILTNKFLMRRLK